MRIKSAVFKIGLVVDNRILDDETPQVAFIEQSKTDKSNLLKSIKQIRETC